MHTPGIACMNMIEKLSKPVVIIMTIIFGLVISVTTVLNVNTPKPLVGYQLSINGEIWAVVEKREELEHTLDAYKQQFVTNIDEEAHIKSVEFTDEVIIEEVEPANNVYNPIDVVLDRLYQNEEEAKYYTVQSGDSLWAIAVENDISISTLVMYNPDVQPERIWPGNKLMMEPAVPSLGVLVKLENTVIESIPFLTDVIQDNTLFRNQRVIVKQGVEGEKAVTYDIQMLNGYPHQTNVIDEVELVAPSTAVVRMGTRTTLARTSSTNFGVTTGRFTGGFGNRRDPISGRQAFHTGIDIAAPRGTPVYAYANGRVVTAGWTGMGGNSVVIDHGNGLKTGYFHLSSINVSVGQTVNIGQKIGGVGSTGYSTGNHLHFEVSVNGKFVNPLNYI